ALLDGLVAVLEVVDFGLQRLVARLELRVLRLLLADAMLQSPHFADAALAGPELDLQRDQQDQEDQGGIAQQRAKPQRAKFGRFGNASLPAYFAALPSASSMRKSWLYFATRSERQSEPVLICVAVVATERSAIVVSSVSPERCEITAAYFALSAIAIASSVSVSVPIWLTLIRIAFAMPLS